MTLLQRIAQDRLARRAIEKVVLRRAAREHVGIVEHVQIGRAAGGVLRRGRVDIDDTELGFLDTGKLRADLVVADEFDPDLAIRAFFQIPGELKASGAFDQQVPRIETRCTELQRMLGLLSETLVIGRLGRLRERGEAEGAPGASRSQQHRTDPEASGKPYQVAARYARELVRDIHSSPPCHK